MKKILIIEDEAEVRGVVVEALTQRGWNPLEAANGCDGIAFAARDLPDLILCDIQMPDKDGFEVLKEVRGRLGFLLRCGS